MKNIHLICSFVFCSLPALSQPRSAPPDVCGLPNSTAALPPGVSTGVNNTGEVEILLDGGARRVKIEGVYLKTDRICSGLRTGVSVVFAGTAIQVVDTAKAVVIDRLRRV